MKKLIAIILALALCAAMATGFAGCSNQPDATVQAGTDTQAEVSDGQTEYVVGVCQLMVHDSLDQATNGFKDSLTAELEKAGKTVKFDVQVAGEATLCTTVVNTFTAKKVDLIMANATPALLAAANATTSIPVLGTSVTDYNDTFSGNIPANVSGTSDAVPFDKQAEMMIETLGLVSGDQVGVLYCINESNSKIQYDAVSALFEAQGITAKAYTFSDISELQALVTAMTGECKAIYIPSDNTVAQNDTIVGTICNEKKIPVYTSYGGAICYASLAIDYYQLGVETGKMAAQILLGEKTAADLEVATLTPTYVYNEELCAQLGIEVPAE